MSDKNNVDIENDNVDTELKEKKIQGKIEKDPTTELLDQIAMLKDSLLRKTAEIENIRKRLEKEKEESIKYANRGFARDLLTVLDNFDRINENISPVKKKIDEDKDLKAYFDGIALCEKELLSVFQRYGISKIKTEVGDTFNHEYHQAISEVENNEHPAGSIVKIFQTGYDYNGRLLRPVMVSVSKQK